MIMKKEPELNWGMILSEADRFNIRNLVLVTAKLASDLTGIKIPDEISVIVSSEKICKLAENRKRFLIQISDKKMGLMTGFNRWWFRMRSLPSMRIRLRITWLITMVLFVTYFVPGGLRKYFKYGELAS
jgi:hypothetical protein